MRQPFVVGDQLPTTHVYIQRSIDTVSHIIKEKYGIMPLRKPLFVSGDGNCLFNAVSVSLCGSQRLAAELRVRTVIEMVMNADNYKHCSDAKTYLTLAPSYKEACVDCGRNGAFSSVWTIVALSTVIGRPIHSVYPPCNGTEGSNGFIYRSLNATFPNDGSSKVQPIYIMWTSTVHHHKGLWSPNHFVPLIALTDVPGIPTELSDPPQTNFSASSPTYQQDFPDLSSSLDLENSSKSQKLSNLSPKKDAKLSRPSTNQHKHEADPSTVKQDTPQNIKASSPVSQQDFQDLPSSSDPGNSPKRQKVSNIQQTKKDKPPKPIVNPHKLEANPSMETSHPTQSHFKVSPHESHQNFQDVNSSPDPVNSTKRQKTNLQRSTKACHRGNKANFNSTPIDNESYESNDCPSIIVTPVQRNFSWSLNQNITTPDELVCTDNSNIESSKTKKLNVEVTADKQTNNDFETIAAEESFEGINDIQCSSDEEITEDNTCRN